MAPGTIWKQVVPGLQDAEFMVQEPLLRCRRIRALCQIEDAR